MSCLCEVRREPSNHYARCKACGEILPPKAQVCPYCGENVS